MKDASPAAIQWLMERTFDRSVDSYNMDQSIAFRVFENSSVPTTEMLIVPQYADDRFVLGSIFGEVTPDITGSKQAPSILARRFVVDLVTAEFLQIVWYADDNVSTHRHVPNVHDDWCDIVTVFETPEIVGEQPSKVPCECADVIRRRTLPPNHGTSSCYNWAGWAEQFIRSSQGKFRTIVDTISGSTNHGEKTAARTQYWWRVCADMGSDYGTQVLRTEYVSSTGRGFPSIGVYDDPELSLGWSTYRKAVTLGHEEQEAAVKCTDDLMQEEVTSEECTTNLT